MRWKAYTESLIRMGCMGHRLYIARLDGLNAEQYSIVHPFTLTTKERHAFVAPADAVLDDSRLGAGAEVREFLQAMSDAAWEIGIRPKQLESHTDELKAVRYHLEDMRKLVLGNE